MLSKVIKFEKKTFDLTCGWVQIAEQILQIPFRLSTLNQNEFSLDFPLQTLTTTKNKQCKKVKCILGKTFFLQFLLVGSLGCNLV